MKEQTNDICFYGELAQPVVRSINAIYPLGTPIELHKTYITPRTKMLYKSNGIFSDYKLLDRTRRNYIISWAEAKGLLTNSEVYHVVGNSATSYAQGELFRTRGQAEEYASLSHAKVNARRSYITTPKYEQLVGLVEPLYGNDAELSVYLHYRNLEGRIDGVYLPQFSNTALLFYTKQLEWSNVADMKTYLLQKMRQNVSLIAKKDTFYTQRLAVLQDIKTRTRHNNEPYFIEHLNHDMFIIVGCGQLCIYHEGSYIIYTYPKTSYKKMLEQLSKYNVQHVSDMVYRQMLW